VTIFEEKAEQVPLTKNRLMACIIAINSFGVPRFFTKRFTFDENYKDSIC